MKGLRKRRVRIVLTTYGEGEGSLKYSVCTVLSS
jgi:hypothetical protein